MTLFPFVDYWMFYAGFTAFVLFMLALDLGVFHRKAHEMSFKESSIWTAIWISLALAFNALLYFYAVQKFDQPGQDVIAKQVGLEFLTGFIIEKSLAIDNIFIFAIVFSYFAIPKVYQHRVLFYGIIGALLFRAIFIGIGASLMQYHAVILFFGVLLILTGTKMLFAGTETQNLENNFIVKVLKKVFRVHPAVENGNFFIRKNGLLYATPLFLAFLFIEVSDIIFALDSVPAIFAITKEPFIVFTSNIFAILGLRSMYFMLSGALSQFAYIKYGLASVLIFVGCKMTFLNEMFGGKFPIGWSLLIIVTLIGSSIVASLLIGPDRKKKEVVSST
jgi:tellurite resistance protein TerC